MEEEISNLVKEKLYYTNNEVNISNIIMSYLLYDCEKCSLKTIEEHLTKIYSEDDTEIYLCSDCLELFTCCICGDYEENGHNCNAFNCIIKVIYCGHCMSKLSRCMDCDMYYCCRNMYKINNWITLCSICINNYKKN